MHRAERKYAVRKKYAGSKIHPEEHNTVRKSRVTVYDMRFNYII